MSYMTAHDNNRKVRGPAKNHTCACGAPAEDWAFQGSSDERVDPRFGRYSYDPYDYAAMWKRCHRRLDKSHITHCPRGHAYDSDNTLIDGRKRKCKTCVYERNRRAGRARTAANDPEWRARKNEYQRQYRARLRQEGAA